MAIDERGFDYGMRTTDRTGFLSPTADFLLLGLLSMGLAGAGIVVFLP